MKYFNRYLAFFAGLVFLLWPLFAMPQGTNKAWSETLKSKSGSLDVYWYTTRPFIFKTADGKMGGIEYEIMEGFRDYLRNERGISLKLNWIESEGFLDTYNRVKQSSQHGVFGVSAFSITPDRRSGVDFSPAYMPDITVMVSSGNVPIANDMRAFKETLTGLTAVTIEGTTYEKDLLKIREEWGIDFKIKYIPSNDNILNTIAAMDNAFGFIDLPIYLVEFNKNTSINVKRQNYLPVKREGYAFIYPKHSDWNVAIEEYFASEAFERKLESITSKYLGDNLYKFIEDLYLNAENNVVLLTKEKEMQYEDLVGKSEKLLREAILRNYLTGAIIIICLFLGVILVLYRKGSHDNKELSRQTEKIAVQSRNIEAQKEQLEKRNERLTLLNDDKNTLIKVLAHDLRSPVNQIHGFANIVLLDKDRLSEEQLRYLDQIIDTATRINGMIGKILDVDALESNRINTFLEKVNLTKLAMQAVTNFQKDAEKKEIDLFYLNQEEGEGIAQLDHLYTTQILENLISNAIKFSPPRKSVAVSVRRQSGRVQLCVKDEGPGFTEEDKKYLFEKFQQLSARPTSGEKSTGLGLAIVRQYTELMNGKVWCDSKVGDGAAFYVEFEEVAEEAPANNV